MFLQVNVLTENMSQQCPNMPTMIKHVLGAEKKNLANLDTIGTFYCRHYLVTFTNGNVFGGDTVSAQWKHKIKSEKKSAWQSTTLSNLH